MNVQEVRDLFVAEYKIECSKRGIPQIDINDKIIASWISRAQQDLGDRLNLLLTYQDVSLVATSVFTAYPLNSNFGQIERAEIQGQKLDIVNADEIDTTSTTLQQGLPAKVAVYNNSAGTYYLITDPLPSQAYTLRVWYKINTLYYAPSDSAGQNWGTFDGVSFTGDLKIPEKYIEGILLWMKSQWFAEFKNEYEMYIINQKSMAGRTSAQPGYRLGGVS